MKNLKPGQRLAFYTVDKVDHPKPSGIEIGMILVERPRGATTRWDFYSEKTGSVISAYGTRLGFAVVAADGKTPVPEPKLQEALDTLKKAAPAGKAAA